MRKEIIINVGTHENRIAVLEDGKLVELFIERPEHERMVGDIYKGIVKTVLPGMQAAFLDIGLERSAFLHVSDVADSAHEYVDLIEGSEDREKFLASFRENETIPIEDMLQKRQEILVQITKEPMGTKGPRVTSQTSLPGRFLVLIPNELHVGVSLKITDWVEKRRLRQIAKEIQPKGMGLIVRTEAEGKNVRDLKSDLRQLMKLWKKIEKRAMKTGAPALIHKDMSLTGSFVRDLFTDDISMLMIDSKKEFKEIQSYLKSVSPSLRSRVTLYRESTPIFDHFDLEHEIEKTLHRKIWLKKGGYIVIDHTEALVAIDVNTGKYVGKSDQQETLLKTNLRAVKEIARQLRLRDIGGLIVIDFIDMEDQSYRDMIVGELRAALKKDRAKSSISPISEFGLVEMTRQRVRPSLLYTFSEPCPVCGGFGRVLSKETVMAKIERWFERASIYTKEKQVRLVVHPRIGAFLTQDDELRRRNLTKKYKMIIEIANDPLLPLHEFKIYLQDGKSEITEQFKT
ncbi:MAG: Rne/Rng family ribonuclease [Gemmatimonadota bacterium]|nr:MAG: Rne/Rng family ribonuclease [Gemmatimonadota bacterium]